LLSTGVSTGLVAMGSSVLAEVAPPGGSASGYAIAAIIAAVGTAVSAVLAGIVALVQALRPLREARAGRRRSPGEIREDLERLRAELADLEE
jgi:hypothetical protein